MAQNCSNDIAAVVGFWDEVASSGNDTEFEALKAQFGMSDVIHPDDVTGARTSAFPLLTGSS